MATHKLLLLPGDGIGPEVMAEVKKLIAFMNARGLGSFEIEEGLVGGCCYDAHKIAITDATMAKAHAADAGGMQLVRWPKQFDVIVTDNLFGDMLSDIAAMLTGSLGMLPSASLGEVDAKTKKRKAMYEPVHGSAPDIAGKGVANPIAMLASFGMALRYSLTMAKEADQIEAAIAAALAQGLRTADIKSEGAKVVTTGQMGDAVIGEMEKLVA